MEKKIVKGFKAFNTGLISKHDFAFNENTFYFVKSEIAYKKNGFHFCERLEDTLKFYPALNNDVDIARVIGYGEILTVDVEGFTVDDYQVIVSSSIKILNKLSRAEIIEEMLQHVNDIDRMTRFISGYKLTEEEIKILEENFHNSFLDKYVRYYQYGDKDAFTKKR